MNCLRIIFLVIISILAISDLHGQTISNNGAVFSVGNGAVVVSNTLSNSNSGQTINNGILNLTDINNSANINGNGIYNIVNSFTNSGVFFPDTSTINYTGTGSQTICAVDYYNLNITQTGSRTVTLAGTGIIGVKNKFIPDLTSTTYLMSGSTLNFKGSATQNIPAINYYNLWVDNASGAALSGETAVQNLVKVVSGYLESSGKLTLVSNAIRTAEIDGSGNGDVLGLVTIQKYLTSGIGYKYISSPFQEATVNELADDINLNPGLPAVYRYNQNLTSSGWVNYSDTSSVLNPLEGYSVNFGNSNSPKTFDLKGVVNNGVFTRTLYNHNQLYTKGFNLVGNPYPSTVDWNAAGGWSRLNIDNAIYYFNASSSDQFSGTYSTYINGVSSDGIANNFIAPMQGFFVHVTNGSYPVSATLEVYNNARTSSVTSVFHRQIQEKDRSLIRLSLGYSNSGFDADPTVIYFDESATNNFDEEFDALKIKNTENSTPSIYSYSSDNEKLSINALPILKDSLHEINLGVIVKKSGTLKFTATTFQGFPEGWRPYFADLETGKYQDLSDNSIYEVELTEGNYENRFKLIFSLNTIADQSQISVFSVYTEYDKLFFILNQDRSAMGEVQITNIQGQVVHRQKLGEPGIYELSCSLKRGIYIVSYLWDKGFESKKVFIGIER